MSVDSWAPTGKLLDGLEAQTTYGMCNVLTVLAAAGTGSRACRQAQHLPRHWGGRTGAMCGVAISAG